VQDVKMRVLINLHVGKEGWGVWDNKITSISFLFLLKLNTPLHLLHLKMPEITSCVSGSLKTTITFSESE